MFTTDYKTVEYEGGKIQRVQSVVFDDWDCLKFFRPEYEQESLDKLHEFYLMHVVSKAPKLFGRMLLFHVPDDVEFPKELEIKRYGKVSNKQIKAAIAFKKYFKIDKNKQPVFKNAAIEKFYRTLEERDCAKLACGDLPYTKAMAIGNDYGMLSRALPGASFKANASFFVMDCFDVDSMYDVVGTPYGMLIKNGEVLSPPLFGREALMVRDHNVISIEKPGIKEIPVEINGVTLRHGGNAAFLERPETASTFLGTRVGIAVVGRKVVAVKHGGKMRVPSSGFLIVTSARTVKCNPDDAVVYKAYPDVKFAIQIGNSLINQGVKTECFISQFYNIRKPFQISYPPSLYPLNFSKARAARMGIGATKDGRPIVVWAEGASKTKYVDGVDSTGASLTEMADLCELMGMYTGVNMDGGGSSQIMLNGRRSFKISDRNPDNTEAERAIPCGIYCD